jgi:hypothetical protein
MPKKQEPLKLVSLEIENIMRITALKLVMPEDGVMIIEGDNEAGKTTAVMSIAILLGGGKLTPDDPIHGDEKSGKITGEIGPYTLTRVFKRDKPAQLVIKSGKQKFKSPQALASSFLSFIALDPLAFMEMDDEKQLATITELMGLDTTALDNEETATYDARTEANREVKRIRGALESTPTHKDAPDVEISAAALMKQAEEIRKHNEEGDEIETSLAVAREYAAECEAKIKALQEQLDQFLNAREKAQKAVEKHTKSLAAFAPKDEDAIAQQIADVDETNRKIRDNAQAAKLREELEAAEAQAKRYDDQLADIQAQKAKARDEAQKRLPIPHLGISEHGITYKGKPLKQAGASAELNVSAGIAMASNSDSPLKLLLIDDAEKLDRKRTRELIEQATANGFDVFMARTRGDGEPTVVIEDGEVKA